ncbi:hypothetical protein LCGC14_1604580 [marine sediment metagenome]|uniref:Uncharacterized protein n=1 Tax=marine sediment metagenome TaxID=412755 RepID=A0A0F9IA37_9ZZZZ
MINPLKRAVLFALLSGAFLISGIIPSKIVFAAIVDQQSVINANVQARGFRQKLDPAIASSTIDTYVFEARLNQTGFPFASQPVRFGLFHFPSGDCGATTVPGSFNFSAGTSDTTTFQTITFTLDTPKFANEDLLLGPPASFGQPCIEVTVLLGKTINIQTSGSSDLYPNGEASFINPFTPWNTDSSHRDLFFRLEVTEVDSIEITFPADTSTPPYDFSNWIIEFSTATSTTATSTDFYLKRIFTGLSTSTIIEVAGGSIELESPLNINNIFAFDPNTTYFSFAQLRYFADFQAVGEIVATSDIISFTTSNLSENDLSFFDLPTSTSTEFAVTCDPESGFFVNSFCNLARFLFVPTTQSIQNFSDLKEQVTTKPPIGYFTLIKNEFSNLNATGTPIFVLEGLEGLETGFLDQVRDVLEILFFLIFGFWLLRRVINFDFHL